MVKAGVKANVKADVLAVVKADEKIRTWRKKIRPNRPFYRHRKALSEGRSVSHLTLQPLTTCLLLRLGEVELAEKTWAAWMTGLRPNTNNDVHLRDPYLMLATYWTWALFDRAMCAHMRGDDKLSLLSVQALMPIWKAVESTAKKRGFKKREECKPEEERPPYLGFLEPAHRLLAEQERRAQQKAKPKEKNVPIKENHEARIKRLIENLENVSARQSGQPGPIFFEWDSKVQSLIEEGDKAVEPLLACLENDTRLTRSVGYHRNFNRRRYLFGVHQAAYIALLGILKISLFVAASTGDKISSPGKKGRKAVAADIRAYWKRFRNVPLEERWYQTLTNNRLLPKHWVQAIENIVRPTNISVSPGGLVCTTTLKPGEKSKLQGEVLRTKKNPSVSELMARRVEDLFPKGEIYSSTQMFDMHKTCEMALDFAKWDVKASLPTLQKQSKRCRVLFAKQWNSHDWTIQIFGRYLAKLTLRRAEAGDHQALAEYSQWLRSKTPKDVGNYIGDIVEPIWRFPEHPAVAKTADEIFNGRDSPWNPLFQGDKHAAGYHISCLFQTPLIGMPVFRKHLIRQLANRQVAGAIKVKTHVRMEITIKGGWGFGASTYKDDPLCPKPGTKATFRVCDIYANLLSGLDGPGPQNSRLSPRRAMIAKITVAPVKQNQMSPAQPLPLARTTKLRSTANPVPPSPPKMSKDRL